MFPPLALLAYIFNTAFLPHLAVHFSLLTLICLISATLLIRKDTENAATDINLGNPLNMINALGFAVIFVGIQFAVFYANKYFGESGLYYSVLIAGLADTDAITISMAKFGLGGEKLQLATNVIIAATLSNTLVKLGISFIKGSKTTGKLVGYVFGGIIIVGMVYILIGGKLLPSSCSFGSLTQVILILGQAL